MRAILQRWLRFAEATGVRFEVVPRHAGWEALGLPDLRGFAPHRRVVRRFAGEPAEFPRRDDVAAGRAGFDDLSVAELWLLHDLAHVLWYDVATLTFGVERWRERGFFVEHHLVSEAFAVLLLDYRVLARTRHRGLAVDLDARAWEEARRRVRGLPPLDSRELTAELVRHYLAGDSRLFLAPPRASGADAELLARWREHEASYSAKQRWYVLLWWDALHGRPLGDRQAVVDDPAVAELVELALQHFTEGPEAAFQAWAASVAARVAGVEDLFASARSAASAPAAAPRSPLPERPDFRFTDAAALERAVLERRLDAADEPAAQELFLLWQLLATQPVGSLDPAERAAVATLAASAQTDAPDRAAWRVVRELARRRLAAWQWTPRAGWRDAFFLP